MNIKLLVLFRLRYDEVMRSYVPPNANLVPVQADCVFKGVIYEVYQWKHEMFDGSFETFEMLKRPDTVKALAVKDGQLIILDQEQPGSDVFYDLPGGRHDVNSETELDAVKRETLEETGMTFTSWKLVEVTQVFSKIEWFIYVFLATDFESQIEQKLDAGEKIKIMQVDFEEVKSTLSNPKNRYLPKELLEKVHSIEELIHLSEIKN